MALSYAFGGDDGTTYDDLKRRQALAQAMWARGAGSRAPKTAMEGINSAAQSITGALLAKKLGTKIKGEQDEFGMLFNGALGGLGAQPAGRPEYTPTPDDQIADDAMKAIGKPELSGGRQEFIEAMTPHALRVSQQTGLDPRLVIAQAAQETGWGKHAPGNNYFGIKSHGKAGGNTLATNEVVNGQTVRVNDSFRGYRDMGDSVDGYASFLQENPRYKAMLSAPDLDGQLAALGQSGYATDPNYARSVGSIAKSIQVPQGGQQPGANPMLLSMLSDPRANDQQRGVLQMLVQQQMQSADPMRQLQMQNLQSQIDARNAPPAAKPTDDIREYQFARGQGYEGSLQDFMLDMRRAGASRTTVNNGASGPQIGTIPQGYQLVQDKETGAYQMAPIPGGPEDMSAKNEKAEDNRETSTSIITTASGRARKAAKNRTVGGVLGAAASWNPSSENAEVYRQVEVLKSNAKIENLTAMRAASPTGGALGAVSDKESQMLAAKAGALDPASPNFMRDLDDYERSLLQTVHGFEAGNRIFEETRSEDDDDDGWTEVNGVKIRVKK